jgi:hypothetical protein
MKRVLKMSSPEFYIHLLANKRCNYGTHQGVNIFFLREYIYRSFERQGRR